MFYGTVFPKVKSRETYILREFKESKINFRVFKDDFKEVDHVFIYEHTEF